MFPTWALKPAARQTNKQKSNLRTRRCTPPGRKFFRPVIEELEARVVLSTFHWLDAVSGDFNDAAKWADQDNNPGVPGAGDDASISFSGITVTSSVDNSISRLTSAAQ